MPTATQQIRVTSPSAMLVIVNQYVDGSFIRRLLPSATFVQEGCHAQKKGVAPPRALFMPEIQTIKSGIWTGRRVLAPPMRAATVRDRCPAGECSLGLNPAPLPPPRLHPAPHCLIISGYNLSSAC